MIDEYYPDAEHIFLLFRRNHNQALGVFDVRELAYEKSEMSAYIRNGFELDKSVFIDYFTWVKNESPECYGLCLHQDLFHLARSIHTRYSQ